MKAKFPFELKNISVNLRNSEETFCYSASVYYRGKRIGVVRNHGYGGCDYEEPTNKALWDELLAEIEKLPEVVSKFEGGDGEPFRYEQHLEGCCAELVADYLLLRDIKRKLRNKLGFYEGEWTGTFRTYDLKRNSEQAVRELISRTRPNAVIINDLDENAMLDLWAEDEERT